MAAIRTVAQRDAAETLYERHGRRVLGFCLTQLRRRDAAEDAAQTTFLRALAALRRGVVPEQESAWLLAIARNVCRARYAADRRRAGVEVTRDPGDLADLARAEEPDAGDLRLVVDALGRVPERQRHALVLREWDGLSYAEIATELGISVSAVETLLFRARRSLTRELRDERRRGLDLLSLLGWGKSLLGGGAAKVAVCAVAAAGLGAAASVEVAQHGSHSGPEPLAASAPAPAPAPAPAKPRRAHAPVGAAQRQARVDRRRPRAATAPAGRAVAPDRSRPAGAATTTPSTFVPAGTQARVTETPQARPTAAPVPKAPASKLPAATSTSAATATTKPTAIVPATETPAVTVPVIEATVPGLTTPGVTTPGVATPTLTTPTVTTPQLTTPAVTTPLATVPAVTVPAVTVPTVTVPSVTVPSVTVPSVSLPAVTVTAPTLPDPLDLLP